MPEEEEEFSQIAKRLKKESKHYKFYLKRLAEKGEIDESDIVEEENS